MTGTVASPERVFHRTMMRTHVRTGQRETHVVKRLKVRVEKLRPPPLSKRKRIWTYVASVEADVQWIICWFESRKVKSSAMKAMGRPAHAWVVVMWEVGMSMNGEEGPGRPLQYSLQREPVYVPRVQALQMQAC